LNNCTYCYCLTEKEEVTGENPPLWQETQFSVLPFSSRLNVTIYYSKIMTTKREMVEEKAIELLKSNPDGMRTFQLINAIKKDLPAVHPKTVNGTVWKLPAADPGKCTSQVEVFSGMCLFEKLFHNSSLN
jgi:hypothetical protein